MRFTRLLSQLALPHLALLIVGCQLLVYCSMATGDAQRIWDLLVFDPDRVLHHREWWRVLTVLALPATLSPVWLFFNLYFFWLIGSALENHWGAPYFNLYCLIGWAALIASGLGLDLVLRGAEGVPGALALTNGWFQSSVFLAFAWVFPEFLIYILLVLPVRVKWLGMLTGVG
jgi:membrane associated rhomboid family serine protease